MQQEKQQITNVLVLLLFLFSFACAHFVENSYKTLATAGVTYDQTMRAVADAYKQGLINESQKAEIMEIAQKFHRAYHAAVDALEEYKKGNLDQAEVEEKVLAVSQILDELLEKVKPLIRENK